MTLAIRDGNFQGLIHRRLPELAMLERLIRSLQSHESADISVEVKVENRVVYAALEFPIYSITIGCRDKSAPCLAVVGGVHGLERIGSEVTIAWMQTINELMQWDQNFRDRLKVSRLVFMPIVNPVGIFLTRRSNGNGVDLMRNSPSQSTEQPHFLLGGHTISPMLPWYRGNTETFESMEVESQSLCQLIEREVFPSRMALSVDVHSGFGSVDRLWFPYARTRKPPPHLAEMVGLKRVFDRSYPNHFYRIEPQAAQYTTHGDIWDWLYDRHIDSKAAGLYLPWTLELGSWMWLKKNPRQLFTSLGAFNPLQPHRLRRILRRHITLFDFLQRAILSPEVWTEFEQNDREQLLRRAMDQWYRKKA